MIRFCVFVNSGSFKVFRCAGQTDRLIRMRGPKTFSIPTLLTIIKRKCRRGKPTWTSVDEYNGHKADVILKFNRVNINSGLRHFQLLLSNFKRKKKQNCGEDITNYFYPDIQYNNGTALRNIFYGLNDWGVFICKFILCNFYLFLRVEITV